MRFDIRGEHRPLEKVFCNDFVFTIPHYQRPYRWTTEHCEELLSDLLGFAGEAGTGARPLDEVHPYFLGSIVLVKAAAEPAAEVIDGQQRLTTLTILLSAIRATTEGEFRAGLERFLRQQGNVVTGEPPEYRLHLRERDAAFFQEYVQEPGGLERLASLPGPSALSDTQERIRENALFLRQRLLDQRVETRQRLASFLVKRCYLVVVSNEDRDAAFRIFTVLNDRGLDLSHADIIKSDVISRVDKEHRERAATKWEEAEERVGTKGFQELLAHIRMMAQRARSSATVLEDFRKYIIQPNDALKVVNEVAQHACAFEQIQHARYENPEAEPESSRRITRALRWLNRVDHSNWVPVALSMFRRVRAPKELAAGLELLERLTAFLFITRGNVNARVPRYARVLEGLLRGQGPGTDAALQLTSEERRNFTAALDGDLYSVSKTRLFVLQRLDEVLGDGSARYEADVSTVEHVLPQHPRAGSQWLEWFPTEEDRGWTDRLGNLVLLARAKNSEASNFDFDEKKKRYFTSPRGVSTYALTTQVLAEAQWTPAVVARRQAAMMSRLCAEWRLVE